MFHVIRFLSALYLHSFNLFCCSNFEEYYYIFDIKLRNYPYDKTDQIVLNVISNFKKVIPWFILTYVKPLKILRFEYSDL